MALPVYRLRRILAATAVLFTLAVAGMYFYACMRVRDVRKDVHGAIGLDIKQTASGFSFSKSDGKRTLFTISARDLKEFKLNGRAELHDVSIVLYGRDSSRFDRISGDDFAYDPKTGDVAAKGEVQIDLMANPAGLVGPDQATPKELKNPIHLKTRDLVFNRESGNAATGARVDFNTAQASGWAVGVEYSGKTNTLTLGSQIHVALAGEKASVIEAEHGVITGDPRDVVLDHARLDHEGGTVQADRAAFHLGPDNSVQYVSASGNVAADTRAAAMAPDGEARPEVRVRSDAAEFLLTDKGNLLESATLSGNVHAEQWGAQPMQGDAGRVILDFASKNELQKVHALNGARLAQKAAQADRTPSKLGATPQDFELTAPTIDFTLTGGKTLDYAETSGAAKITLAGARGSSVSSKPQSTVVTAGKFVAKFAGATLLSAHRDEALSAAASPTSRKGSEKWSAHNTHRTHGREGSTYLASLHGEPGVRIVSSIPGEPDRISTSDSVDAVFLPEGGIDSLTQHSNFAYDDGQPADKHMQAWADRAFYTPGNQELLLTGSPRLTRGSMATTANAIRINRASRDAFADGDVKTTYSDVKENSDGALLAASSPIHVTARTMSAQSGSGLATYTGDARLWQDANLIEAESIRFDRDQRFVTARGISKPVATTLVQRSPVQGGSGVTSGVKTLGKSEYSSPISITSRLLTYADSERKIHYEGNVQAKGVDFTASAKNLDVYLLPHGPKSSQMNDKNRVSVASSGPGQLDRMVAQGDVSVHQLHRHAEGQTLVYTAGDDMFVLTGGSPSIFDAEQGKITGVSLTFFRRDDRVLVEGGASTPVVTETRVAR